MKKVQGIVIGLLALAIVGVILLMPAEKVNKPKGATVGTVAPNISLQDPEGNAWTLSDHTGKIVLINFWATWCDPCREEMPALNRLNKDLGSEEDFEIMTILYKDEAKKARQFMKDNNLDLPFVLDTYLQAAGVYGVTGVPETYIIDRNGLLVKKVLGPIDFDAPEVRDYFNQLLASPEQTDTTE